MQINKELIEIPDAIVKIARQADSRLSLEEVMDIHKEYQSCNTVKVCPICGCKTNADQLKLVIDTPGTRNDPPEGHTVCDHCYVSLTPYDLVKPDFQTWLLLTA